MLLGTLLTCRDRRCRLGHRQPSAATDHVSRPRVADSGVSQAWSSLGAPVLPVSPPMAVDCPVRRARDAFPHSPGQPAQRRGGRRDRPRVTRGALARVAVPWRAPLAPLDSALGHEWHLFTSMCTSAARIGPGCAPRGGLLADLLPSSFRPVSSPSWCPTPLRPSGLTAATSGPRRLPGRKPHARSLC